MGEDGRRFLFNLDGDVLSTVGFISAFRGLSVLMGTSMDLRFSLNKAFLETIGDEDLFSSINLEEFKEFFFSATVSPSFFIFTFFLGILKHPKFKM